MSAQDNDRLETLRAAVPEMLKMWGNYDNALYIPTEITFSGKYGIYTAHFTFEIPSAQKAWQQFFASELTGSIQFTSDFISSGVHSNAALLLSMASDVAFHITEHCAQKLGIDIVDFAEVIARP